MPDYNPARPYSSLGCKTPAAYAEISPQPAILCAIMARRDPVQAIEVGCARTSRMNCIRQIGPRRIRNVRRPDQSIAI